MRRPFVEVKVGEEFYVLYNGEKTKALKIHPITLATHTTPNTLLLEGDLAFRVVRCRALEDTWPDGKDT